jgi:hypothetical protein
MEALMACYQHGLLYLEALADEAPSQPRAVNAEAQEGGADGHLPGPALALHGGGATPVALAG